MEIVAKTIENDEKYLRQVSKPVTFENEEYKKDIELLREYCLGVEGFALAAVQIGIPKRIIYLKNTTLDISLEDKSYNESKVLINPVVINRKGHTRFWESCFSCKNNTGLVSRPYKITLKYYDIDGRECTKVFKGFESTVLSHELDHLDGVLHMDISEEIIVMTPEERKEFRKKHPYKIISKTCEYKNKGE